LGAYFRHKLPETPRFTAHVKGDYEKASRDIHTVMSENAIVKSEPDVAMSNPNDTVGIRPLLANNLRLSVRVASVQSHGPSSHTAYSEDSLLIPKQEETVDWDSFKEHYSQWKNFKILLGCSLSWFFLDIAFYGLGLNQATVLGAIGFAPPTNQPYANLHTIAAGNCIINLLGAIPGYYFTVAFVEKMGRVKIQLMGFTILTIIFIILAVAYDPLTTNYLWLFIMLYCIAQFFFNFGPNTTTFIVPGEIFPTKYRTTSHGICAATGKLGAILSAYGFTSLNDSCGVGCFLAFLGACMFLGLLASLVIPETAGVTLEDLAKGIYKPVWGKATSTIK